MKTNDVYSPCTKQPCTKAMDRAHQGSMACTGPKGKAGSRHDHKAATQGTAGAKRGKKKGKKKEKREEKREKGKKKGFPRGEPALEDPSLF